jgi:hypothetical protein
MEQQTRPGVSREFEKVCARILSAHGYDDETDIQNYRNPDPADLVVVHRETRKAFLVEVKLYLSSQIPTDRFYQAINLLLRKRGELPESSVLLIVSVPLPEPLKAVALESGIDEVWDLPLLEQKASISPELAEQLNSILAQAGVGDRGTLGPSSFLLWQEAVGSKSPGPLQPNSGSQICKALRQIPTGKAGWQDFEKLCRQALVFLFGSHFGSWSEQSETDDGLHRRDFLASLRPKNDFWISLAHDFHCRYVVFEFKNYEKEISQSQIYSTEKYLYTTALRSVAIVVARNGADTGAQRAAGGALRESGKLILILSLDDLCQMLNARDNADDPELVLYTHLDKLLTGLGR